MYVPRLRRPPCPSLRCRVGNKAAASMKSLHLLRPPRRGRARRGFGRGVRRSGPRGAAAPTRGERLRAGPLRGRCASRSPPSPRSAAAALRVPLPTRVPPCRRRAPSLKRCRAAIRPRALFVLATLAWVRLHRHFRPRRPSLFIITRPSISVGGGRAAHRSATTGRWYHVSRAPRRR